MSAADEIEYLAMNRRCLYDDEQALLRDVAKLVRAAQHLSDTCAFPAEPDEGDAHNRLDAALAKVQAHGGEK